MERKEEKRRSEIGPGGRERNDREAKRSGRKLEAGDRRR